MYWLVAETNGLHHLLIIFNFVFGGGCVRIGLAFAQSFATELIYH